jgi:hypothetical protein
MIARDKREKQTERGAPMRGPPEGVKHIMRGMPCANSRCYAHREGACAIKDGYCDTYWVVSLKPILIGNFTERLLKYSEGYPDFFVELEANPGMVGTSLINFPRDGKGELHLEWLVDISRLMSFKYPEKDVEALIEALAADIGRIVTEEIAHLSGAFGHTTEIPWGYYAGYPWEEY